MGAAASVVDEAGQRTLMKMEEEVVGASDVDERWWEA